MQSSDHPRRRAARRQRLTPFALLVGLLASAVSTTGVAATYSALTASISNTRSIAGAGTLTMQETDASGSAATSCASSTAGDGVVACSRFDRYGGGTLRPGQSVSTGAVRIYSTGGLDAQSFTLTPGTCAVQSNPIGGAGSICTFLQITATCTRYSAGVQGTAVDVFPSGSTLQSISSSSIDLVAKGCRPARGAVGGDTYTAFSFTVALASTAGIGVQGQTAAQALTWRYTAGS